MKVEFVHTEQTGFTVTTMHCFALEVRCKRAFAIRTVLEGFIAISAKCTGKHTNVTEYTLGMA